MDSAKRYQPYSAQSSKSTPTSNRPNTSKYFSNENYEHNCYLSGLGPNQKKSYPTLQSNNGQKGILKNRTNQQSSNSKQTPKPSQSETNSRGDDSQNLKILTVTTKSMIHFSNRFENLIKKSNSNRAKLGPYLFEIIAQLDSTVSEDSSTGAREFSIKDQNGRIHCIFYEIDRRMDRLVRDSWIRCIGKYNLEKRLFQCVSVRLVQSQVELFSFGFQVNQTNAYLKKKFF